MLKASDENVCYFGNQPLRLMLVGGMGSIGDNLYRLQQPAAALAQLQGVEVF